MAHAILNYRNVKVEVVDADTYMNILNYVTTDESFTRIGCVWARRLGYLYKKYMIERHEKYVEIRYCDDEPRRIRLNMIMYGNNEKSKISGFDAFTAVEDLWQQIENVKDSIYKSFSGNKYRDQFKAIKKCVPEQIAYCDRTKGKIFKKAFKADKSSAFPSQIIKSVPTLRNSITLNGVWEPTEEYPFAFYTKSHHLSIYNEFSTKELNHRFYKEIYDKKYDDTVDPLDEVTILCKASEYSFERTFRKLYNERKQNPDNKLYMNAFIGYCHKNNDPRLSHIAAVVIARNNYDMIQKCNYLLEEDNLPVYIATDSIIWLGHDSDIATTEKYLGSFTYEGKNGKAFLRAVGAYQYLDENGVLTTKCSYLQNGEDKDKIEFGNLPESKSEKIILDSNNRVIKLL